MVTYLSARRAVTVHRLKRAWQLRESLRHFRIRDSHLPVTFAWSGDLGGQGRCRRGVAGYPIFDVMRAQQLDFFLFLGDTMYSDNPVPVSSERTGC